MRTIAPIIIRIPDGIVDPFAVNHENQGLFRRDLISDRLIFNVEKEGYNSAKPTLLDTKFGYTSPYSDSTVELYSFEATDNDCRGEVVKQVLNQIAKTGNLSIYGVTQQLNSCSIPLIAVEDFHSRESDRAFERGYSLRVGVLQSEVLKGSTLSVGNIYEGQPYVLASRSTFISSSTLNATEWAKFKVIKQHNQYVPYDSIWQPNTSYSPGQRIAAIAPRGAAKVSAHQNGIRLLFTQTHAIDDNKELKIYVPEIN